jgi:hypothetical protein
MPNVKSIVEEAIYKSLQDKEFQPVINGLYLQYGLNELNLILDEWRTLIPFAQSVTFDNVDNVENSTFVSVETVNFILNTTSQPLKPVTLTEWKEQQAIIGLIGIPVIYYFDELTQSIEVYPKPSNPQYKFTIWGRIQQVTLGEYDEIPANLPPFMKSALIYELGGRMASNFGTPWSAEKENKRQALVISLKNKKSINLRAPRNIVFGLPDSQQVAPFPWLYYVSGGT